MIFPKTITQLSHLILIQLWYYFKRSGFHRDPRKSTLFHWKTVVHDREMMKTERFSKIVNHIDSRERFIYFFTPISFYCNKVTVTNNVIRICDAVWHQHKCRREPQYCWHSVETGRKRHLLLLFHVSHTIVQCFKVLAFVYLHLLRTFIPFVAMVHCQLGGFRP